MISVIVPVYNGARWIASALESIAQQSLPPDEVIVIDDGSSDESAEIAERFCEPVKVLRRPHQGGAAALNAGLAEAKGDLIAFLDADDLWSPDKLALQSAILADEASLDAVFGRVVQFVDMECKISEPQQVDGHSQSFVGVNKITMLIHRSALDRVGSFDSEAVADFPDWYARAVRTGIRAKVIEQVVAFRRIHRNNTTRSQRRRLHSDYLKIARKLAALPRENP